MAGSEQRARGEASGGRRIDDHSFWMGGKKEGVPLPLETGMKRVPSTEGAGSLMKYEDTNDRIVKAQEDGVKKAKAHQGRLAEWRN